MRILVFSDSHNRDNNMRRAIELNKYRFDVCIHLGDGCREFERLYMENLGKPFVTVNGNGEDLFGSVRVNETVLELDGYRFFITHGHKYNVKYGYDRLIYRTLEKECDVALFGHTHIPYNKYMPELGKKGLYLFNPGSISQPPFGKEPSYGVIEIVKEGISLNNATV